MAIVNTKDAKIAMIRFADQTSIDTPAAGYKMLAFKSTAMFYVNESGTEYQFATLTGTETFTNKTLTTPTVGDFTNSTHDHEDAAGGGTLDAAAISAGTLDNARVNWAAPSAIGGTTPVAVTGTTITGTALVGGSLTTALSSIVADLSMTTANRYVIVDNTSGIADLAVTLPDPTTCSGQDFFVKRTDANASYNVVVGQYAAETIDGATAYTLSSQYDSVHVVSDGTNWHII